MQALYQLSYSPMNKISNFKFPTLALKTTVIIAASAAGGNDLSVCSQPKTAPVGLFCI
jgi:hypothetical protein